MANVFAHSLSLSLFLLLLPIFLLQSMHKFQTRQFARTGLTGFVSYLKQEREREVAPMRDCVGLNTFFCAKRMQQTQFKGVRSRRGVDAGSKICLARLVSKIVCPTIRKQRQGPDKKGGLDKLENR